MYRKFNRYLYTFTKNYFYNLTNFKPDNSFPNNNKLFVNIRTSIEKLMNKNNDNMTSLHRWCINTSPKYKDTCNWEKKLDNAGRDNCYSSHN